MKKLVLTVFGIIPILLGCGDEPPCSTAIEEQIPFSTSYSVPITALSCEAILSDNIGYGDLSADQAERIEQETANFRISR